MPAKHINTLCYEIVGGNMCAIFVPIFPPIHLVRF